MGTVGSVLSGNNPPPAPDYSDTGFDTASTTIRAYGDNSSNGFGNQKGLDLWTYFPSKDFVGQLYVVPPGVSDLAITKTHVGDFVVGVNGVYTISVQNVGSEALAGQITVTDPVPAGLNVVSAVGTGWACGVSGQDVTCTETPAGGLASGAVLPDISLTVNPTPAAVPTVTNTATVTNVNDIDPDNNSSSSPTRIQVSADLAVSKTDGTTALDAGGSTTYTLVVTNAGPSSVTGAILADPAASGLAKTAVACAPSPGQCVAPPSVTDLEAGFALPALASGQTYALAVTATVTATSGSVANTATVAAPAGVTDPGPGQQQRHRHRHGRDSPGRRFDPGQAGEPHDLHSDRDPGHLHVHAHQQRERRARRSVHGDGQQGERELPGYRQPRHRRLAHLYRLVHDQRRRRHGRQRDEHRDRIGHRGDLEARPVPRSG